MPAAGLKIASMSRLQALLYASGNFGKSAILTTFDTVLFFYLVTICAMPVSSAGTIIMLAMVWDGFGDLVIGYWADRTGRTAFLKILLAIGAPICGSAFAAIFYLAYAQPGNPVLLIALLCWACRIGFTLCDVAHNSMLVNISANERGASASSGLRLMFSAAGTSAVGLAFRASLAMPTIRSQKSTFMVYALLGGLLYTATLLAATRVHSVGVISRRRPGAIRFWQALRALTATAPYRRLCAIIIFQAGGISLFMKSLPFIGLWFFGGATWAGGAIVLMTCVQAAALPALILLGRARVSSRSIMMLSHGAMALSITLLFISAPNRSWLTWVALAGIGIANSGMSMTIWTKLALVVREKILAEHGLHAMAIGLFLAILKCSSGLGNGLLAFGLAWGKALSFSQASIVLTIGIAAPALASLACTFMARRT